MAKVSHRGKLGERESLLIISNDFSSLAWVASDINWSLENFYFELIRKSLILCFISFDGAEESLSLVSFHCCICKHLVLNVSEVFAFLHISNTSYYAHFWYKIDILVSSFNVASD